MASFFNGVWIRSTSPVTIELTIANVHRYFKAETHFSSFWFGPHGALLGSQWVLHGEHHKPAANKLHAQLHERTLMKIMSA